LQHPSRVYEGSILESLLYPLLIAAIAAIAATAGAIGGYCFANYRKVLASRKPPAPQGIEESAQAVTQLEIIEALGALGLSSETVSRVQGNITTVAQLKSVVAQLNGAASRDVKNKMLPLAVQYLTELQSTSGTKESPQFLAKLIVIGQFSAPSGTVHPAFKSMDEQLAALQRTESWADLSQELNAEISNNERSSIQQGPWVRSDLVAKVRNEFEREREIWREIRAPRPREFRREPSQPYSYDVIEPTDEGMIAVKRCTRYGGVRLEDNTSSDSRVCEYDPCRTFEESQFWIAVATRQMERFVGIAKTENEFRMHGNLLNWTRFLEAIQRNSPSLEASATEASNQGAPVVEEEVVLPAELSSRQR
jgi:hypothetical protein